MFKSVRTLITMIVTVGLLAVPIAANAVQPVAQATTTAPTAFVPAKLPSNPSYGVYKRKCKGTKKRVLNAEVRYQVVRTAKVKLYVCYKDYGRTTVVKAYRLKSKTKEVWGGYFGGHSVVITDPTVYNGDVFTGAFKDGKRVWFYPEQTIRCPSGICNIRGMLEIGITRNWGDPVVAVDFWLP